ncbi:MAG TPA: hypothetical protein PK966_10650, partial [Syntrophorhabdaceae bacterium]|nr:hypothetical protein [Syntrophorhabdaceae bacterium]
MTEKAKGSRIRGFKGSSGLLGIFFQNIKAKGARQKAEDRGQRSEGRGQRTEDRGQRSEDRGQRAEVRGLEGWQKNRETRQRV